MLLYWTALFWEVFAISLLSLSPQNNNLIPHSHKPTVTPLKWNHRYSAPFVNLLYYRAAARWWFWNERVNSFGAGGNLDTYQCRKQWMSDMLRERVLWKRRLAFRKSSKALGELAARRSLVCPLRCEWSVCLIVDTQWVCSLFGLMAWQMPSNWEGGRGLATLRIIIIGLWMQSFSLLLNENIINCVCFITQT